MYLPHINPSDPDSIRRAFQKLNAQLGSNAKPSFAGLILSELTLTGFDGIMVAESGVVQATNVLDLGTSQ